MNDNLDNELDLDFVAGLLGDVKVKTPTEGGKTRKKFIVRKTQYPSATSRYVTCSIEARCVSRGCSAPTIRRYGGIPYCMIHGEFVLAQIIERLETQVITLKKRLGEE